MFTEDLKSTVSDALKEIWNFEFPSGSVLINETRPEFEGDYTVVVFPFTKALKLGPPQVAAMLGDYLVKQSDLIVNYNVVKGFLNLSFDNKFWGDKLQNVLNDPKYGYAPSNGNKVLVEFSSPNTNKPLHLGHIRNILLGWSSSQLLNAAGYDVVKTQIVNDRGIAICKSMLAYQLFGKDETPESTEMKGDHFIGRFYVLFESKFREEYTFWQSTPKGVEVFKELAKEGEESGEFFKRYKNEYFNEHSILGSAAKEMLLKWEDGEGETMNLWTKMNNWVYEGFEETYKELGVKFDGIYYESETYKLGKKLVNEGLDAGIFYKKEDGSVWVDLEDVGMDHKIVLRSDGTSVYMTQDLGTAQQRNKDHSVNRMVYVVADEQDYHFKALFETLKKLKEPYADELYHLSYGMVDLPTGKMKSREGRVVDADDLISDVIQEAKAAAGERGEIEGLSEKEQEDIFRKIGLGALKFFIIKVNPRKRMTFDPKESVDMQGQTGPYIQNAYVRIQSVLRKSDDIGQKLSKDYDDIKPIEKHLIQQLLMFPELVVDAAEQLDPSTLANYCYNLAKMYHKFYHDLKILSAETEGAKIFRLKLSKAVGEILKTGMSFLGIEMPERM